MRVVLLLVLATTGACGSPSEPKAPPDPKSPIPPFPPGEPTPPTVTYAHLVSEGEWIGGGLTYDLDTANASFTTRFDVGTLEAPLHHLYVDILRAPPNPEDWEFHFSAPLPSPMVPGDYPDAVRWPFQRLNQPGLSVIAGGRGCNVVTGSFTVHSIHVEPDLQVSQVHISFVQYCEGRGPPLRGDLSYVAPVQAGASE